MILRHAHLYLRKDLCCIRCRRSRSSDINPIPRYVQPIKILKTGVLRSEMQINTNKVVLVPVVLVALLCTFVGQRVQETLQNFRLS
jgi:hypothetical protein